MALKPPSSWRGGGQAKWVRDKGTGAGGMGRGGNKRRGEEGNGGERPDYLVEDEET